MLLGKFTGIADAYDPTRGVAPKNEGRERYRCRNRLKGPRRHIDDQPLNLATADALKMACDRFNVPSMRVGLTRSEGVEDFVQEGPEIITQQRLQ
jgi:hypothetical protein